MSALFERVRQAMAPDYELERELGAGGMGVVFVAREPSLNRRVAVKVLRPQLATAVAAERFRREGQMLARAGHPNVVTVYRAFEPGGLSVLVMELLGGNLADRLGETRLSEAEALKLGRQLLEGLAHVHRLGLVHRDVKPGNIFLRGDQAVLGDFGISRQLTPEEEGLTDPFQRPGTPPYMSPEQLAGEEVGPAADLYSAGAVIYEMLTGRRWKGVGDVRRADWSGVRRPVARVLQRALAYEAHARWPDATTFIRALMRARRARPLRAWLVGAGIVSAAAVVVLAWHYVVRPSPPSRYAAVAVLPFRAEPDDSTVAEAIARAIAEHLEYAVQNAAFPVTPMYTALSWWGRHHLTDTLPATAFRELRAERVVWGRVERRGGRYFAVVEVHRRGDTTRTVVEQPFRPDSLIVTSFTLAYQVVDYIEPSLARSFRGSDFLRREHNPEALDSLMAADRAFWQENWDAAEHGYNAALARDSTLGRAWWGLYNVQRWRRGGISVDLRRVQAMEAGGFRPIDRELIAADLKTGTARLDAYAAAAGDFPNQAYPLLLLGNELFHRGGLMGFGLDSAVAALRAAQARDPDMAPVLSTLAWALIRQGQDSSAGAALARYAEILSPFAPPAFPLRQVLELGRLARFSPTAFRPALTQFMGRGEGTGSMARAFRFGMSLGIPEAQELVSGLIADHATDGRQRAGALVGRAVARVALGRVRQALADLDSAARLDRSDEMALQQGAWRVLFPALGVPGLEHEAASGRVALRSLASRPGSTGARARWALAVDAYATGDTSAGRTWEAGLPADTGFQGLHGIVEAFGEAARGDTAAALRRSAPSALPVQFAEKGALGDPFARAAVHLARGRWLARRDPAAADREWLWYENADARDWPGGPPQAAEVDWALETWGRYLRSTLAAPGDVGRLCALLPDVARRWEQADSAYTAYRRRAQALLGRCGRQA